MALRQMIIPIRTQISIYRGKRMDKRLFETQIKNRNYVGSLGISTAIIFFLSLSSLYIYYGQKKEIQKLKKEQVKLESNKGIGKPLIGAPFQLTDHFGQLFSSNMLLGKYFLVYFGFSHCPDICPEELDKISEIVTLLDKEAPVPVFVTCDPFRDSTDVIRNYLKGLTGTFQDISKLAKSYRVYFSHPPDVEKSQLEGKDGGDYLVDHSIFFYLMDREGKFVDCYGKDKDALSCYESIKNHLKEEAEINI